MKCTNISQRQTLTCTLLAAESPLQEKPSTAERGVGGRQSPTTTKEISSARQVSEVHKQFAASNIDRFFCSRQKALCRRSRAQRKGGLGGRQSPTSTKEISSSRQVSEVHKHLAASNIDRFFARGRKPSAGEAERSGERCVQRKRPLDDALHQHEETRVRLPSREPRRDRIYRRSKKGNPALGLSPCY